MKDKKKVSPEISAYMSSLAKKSGEKQLKEKGREYFSRISKMRKIFKKPEEGE